MAREVTDAKPMDPEILHQAPLYAVLAAVGFLLLAFVLLYPVWRFLKREEELSRRWTPDEIARRSIPAHESGDGATDEPELTVPGPRPE